ncbi:6942_t:CDS:2 [Diversispora eburnea]|uniref:6942_t:CDS:1 n=1 Tax=Diversispora eburnea TaxID=1213867 RepID=A0A9N9A3D9_9GLOM|nr:6942_t:CDS:2 [Diversispora eburnea]
MFLPVGYPDSVHECYAKFHFWLGLETFIGSSVRQAMLSSLGLGHAEAAAGAVAIQWVLKDGFGEIGKLFFIKRFAYSFDSHPKTWKMVGYFLQLCTCVVRPSFFLPLASLGNAFESIQYSILGACHMAFVRNFAVGDVVAKDDAQMSFAHLLGMLCGVGLITVSHEPAFLFTCFTAFAPFNVYITLALLNSAQFEILNQAKLALIARQYIDCDKVPTMEELKDREIGFGEWIRPGKSPIGVKIKLGVAASEAFRRTEDMMDSLDVLWNILLNGVDMKDIKGNNISNEDITQYIRKAMRESHKWTNEKFGKFVAELDDKDWQSDVVFWSDKGFRVKWERNKEGKI